MASRVLRVFVIAASFALLLASDVVAANPNAFIRVLSDEDAMGHPGVEAVILATPHSLQ